MFLSGVELSNDQRKSQDLFSWKKPFVLMEQSACQGEHSKLNWRPWGRWFLGSIHAPDVAEKVIERTTCGFQIVGN